MKDLLRHRGIAAPLFLAALFLEQLRHPTDARHWRARQLNERSLWKDDTLRGELLTPSWASLALGFVARPNDPARDKQFFHTPRYRQARSAFNRLAAVDLYDPIDRVLHAEDRSWRWNPRVVEKTYRAVDTRAEQSFVVPAWVFTGGLYLRLTGPGLHTLLVALQHQQSGSVTAPFHLRGLTWSSFDRSFEQLKSEYLTPEVTATVNRLRVTRYEHELEFNPTPQRRAEITTMLQQLSERSRAKRR